MKSILIDPERVIVKIDSNIVNLTISEFDILYMLTINPGRVMSREQIMDKLKKFDISNDIFDRTIDVHIKNIRKKIKNYDSQKEYIMTIVGRGYKFNEDIN